MYTLEEMIETFTDRSRQILDDRLVGIYLHGSAVMGCFSPDKSDVDLLVVVNSTVPDDIKKRYMDMVTELSSEAPANGIEMSIIKESDCDPFVYPTPFELHFSIAHLEWYRNDPDDYISKMKGTDKDLAAH
ncbi:MAG: nucleotidyltransferase domain-containing protein, partial [Oscillospiraceae bacterium]|nr:nucleotidyltransferase domain-containing protein [Oscillospiraceae bacterium]